MVERLSDHFIRSMRFVMIESKRIGTSLLRTLFIIDDRSFATASSAFTSPLFSTLTLPYWAISSYFPHPFFSCPSTSSCILKSLSLDRYTCFYYYQIHPYTRPIGLFRPVWPHLSEDLGSQQVIFGGQGRILKTDSSI